MFCFDFGDNFWLINHLVTILFLDKKFCTKKKWFELFFRGPNAIEPNRLKNVPILENAKPKLLYTKEIPDFFNISEGIGIFEDCPIKSCRITTNETEKKSADLVWFFEKYQHIPEYKRPDNQLYAFYSVEPPAMRPYHFNPPDTINWTITYR